jgi:hypothetical protein
MYILQDSKDNIQNFLPIHNNLFYKIRSNDYFLYQNGTLIDKENFGYFGFDKYICFNHKDTTDLVDSITDSKTTIPVTFTGGNFYNNTFIISKNSIREGVGLYSSNYAICQLLPFEELYELPHRYYGSGYRFENQYIQIQNERRFIKSLSLVTGEYEWEFDVSSFPSYHFIDEEKPEEIKRLIGVWNDLLLVVLSSGKLLALDVHTGKQTWLMTSDIYKLGGPIPLIDQAILSQDEGKLYALRNESFIEIDLEQVKIIRYQDYSKTNLNPFVEAIGIPERIKNVPGIDFNTIRVDTSRYYKGRFYFRAYTLGVSGSDPKQTLDHGYVGIFNIATEKIEWWYDLGSSGHIDTYHSGQDIQVTDKNLYFLDNIGTLHIFEKESKR